MFGESELCEMLMESARLIVKAFKLKTVEIAKESGLPFGAFKRYWLGTRKNPRLGECLGILEACERMAKERR